MEKISTLERKQTYILDEIQLTANVQDDLANATEHINNLVRVHMSQQDNIRDNDLQMILQGRNFIVQALAFWDELVQASKPQLTIAPVKHRGREA